MYFVKLQKWELWIVKYKGEINAPKIKMSMLSLLHLVGFLLLGFHISKVFDFVLIKSFDDWEEEKRGRS